MKRNCPVCGNRSASIIKKINMELPSGYKLPNSYDVVSCDICGMCYADTEATQNDYDYYYTNCNIYSDLHYDISSRTKALMDLIHRFCNKDSSILDMGFGNGEWLQSLKNEGFHNLVGIDPSIDSVKALSGKGINSYVGNVFDSTIFNLKNKFDCCFMLSVLEHLLYPGKAIAVLSEYIKPHGLIIIEIPNYAMSHYTDAPIPNMFNQEHINYFSPKSFSALFEMNGFRTIEMIPYCISNDEIDSYAIIGVFKKTNYITSIIEKDLSIVESITKYINNQLNKESERNKLINSLAENHTPIYIWGTGAFISRLISISELSKCNIIAFVDNNHLKQNTEIYNIKIISPFDIKDNTAPILIASMLHTNDIYEQIIKMQLPNKIIPLVSL